MRDKMTKNGRVLAAIFLNVLCSYLVVAQSKWPAFEIVPHDTYPSLQNGTIRSFSGCVRLLDGRIYCAGATTIDATAKFVPSTETALFDPRTRTWKQAAPLAEARRLQTMNLLPDGRVLMAGGYSGIPDPGGYPISAVQSAEIYDPYHDRSERIVTPGYNWSWMYSILLIRPVSILLPDSRLLMISRQTVNVESSIILDWKTGQIERVPLPPFSTSTDYYVLNTLADGRTLLSSHRFDQTGGNEIRNAAPALGIFDLTTKQWTQIPWPDPQKFLYWILLPAPPFQANMPGNQLVGYYYESNSTPKSYLTYLDLSRGLTTAFEIAPLTETSEPLIKLTPSDWGEILVSGQELYPENKDRIYNINNQSVTYFANPKGWRVETLPLANGDFWNYDYSYVNPVDVPLNAIITSAASYAVKPLARGGFITIFGEKLTEGGNDATLFLLTAEMKRLPLQVIYRSSTQINAVLPNDVAAEGRTLLCSAVGGAAPRCTPMTVVRTAPDVFTADATGRGAPAALFYRAKKDGSEGRYEPVTSVENGKPVLVPARPPAADEVLFLVLFGTGWRNRAPANGIVRDGVSVYFNQTFARVAYAGPQGNLSGLDQMNIEIPLTLRGRQSVQMQADGLFANPVEIALIDQ